jgi:hypothetical protein
MATKNAQLIVIANSGEKECSERASEQREKL